MANALIDLSKSLADAVEEAGQSVVGLPEGGQRGVSGTLWSSEVVVTAEHAIRGRQEFTVVLPSGEKTGATVAGRDPGTDLAVLKLVKPYSKSANFGDGSKLRAGNIVLAIGRREEGLSTSYGVISAIGGPWRTWQGGRMDSYWRLDVLPFPGFSGGPLVDVEARLLGVNTSGPRRSLLSIPASTVAKVVKQLLEKGRIARGYLGAGLQAVKLPESIRQSIDNSRDYGLLIVSIEAGAPADRGGLLVGDILLAVDGNAVSEPADLRAALDWESVGRAVTVQLVRGGKRSEAKVTIDERPGR